MTDDELIKGCIANNGLAQKELYDRYGKKMMGICVRYCENREECLKKISSDRKIAKLSYLKVAYGGNISLYDNTIGEFTEPDGDTSDQSTSSSGGPEKTMVKRIASTP